MTAFGFNDLDTPKNKRQLIAYLRSLVGFPQVKLRSRDEWIVVEYKEQISYIGVKGYQALTFMEWEWEIRDAVDRIEDETILPEDGTILTDASDTEEKDATGETMEDMKTYARKRITAGSKWIMSKQYPTTMEALFYHLTVIVDLPSFKIELDEKEKTYYVYYRDMKVNTLLASIDNISLWEWEFKVQQAIDLIDRDLETGADLPAPQPPAEEKTTGRRLDS